MGVAASTNSTSIATKMIQSAYNSCPAVSSVNITTIKDVNFDPPPPQYCNPPSSFTVGQTASLDADCILGSLQSNISQEAAKLNATTQAGILGLSASTNIADFKTSLANYTSNLCDKKSTKNFASIKDTTVRSCQFQVIQNATEKTSCQINATQDAASKVAASLSASSSGFLGNFLSGNLLYIIIAIIIALVIVGTAAGFYFKSQKNKGKQQKEMLKARQQAARYQGYGYGWGMRGGKRNGNDKTCVNRLLYLILGILLILLVIILILKPFQKKPMGYSSTSMTDVSPLHEETQRESVPEYKPRSSYKDSPDSPYEEYYNALYDAEEEGYY